jgi:hypothetical protein
MDSEMSTGARIAVTMLIVGAVLTIVAITVSFGQDFYRGMLGSISNGVSYTYAAELEALSDYNEALPAASVFVALEKNRGAIRSISGTAYSVTVNSIDDVQSLFKHQIKCTITQNGEMYDVVIGP